jgi:DNA mismatch repair protein MutS2
MFAPADEVEVIPLKRRGRVIEVVRGGVYRVQVGGVHVTCREAELRAVDVGKRARRRHQGVERAPDADRPAVDADPTLAAARRSLRAIDLHGLGVEEARNRVVAHLSRAIVAGLDRVEVIHGLGTGTLKAAITRDLRRLSAVRQVKPHPANPGVLIVYL